MNLTNKPLSKNFPPTHYIFLEKVGEFRETAPSAWQELHQLFDHTPGAKSIRGAMAIFKMNPKMVYRAGFILAEKPNHIPDGLQYIHFNGGHYSAFTLTGPYQLLPQAWGSVMENIGTNNLTIRDDFFIEHYLSDPRSTPPEEIMTDLLIPTKE